MRKSFYNHLLLKDDVGRPKPTTRMLPEESFTYGKPEIRDPENASQGKDADLIKFLVATSWKFH